MPQQLDPKCLTAAEFFANIGIFDPEASARRASSSGGSDDGCEEIDFLIEDYLVPANPHRRIVASQGREKA